MYSLEVSLILLGMIVTGAARSVAVQLFYQLGFHQPVFVTLLYLTGQSLALVVYYVMHQIDRQVDREERKKAAKTLRSVTETTVSISTTDKSPCEPMDLYIKLEDASSPDGIVIPWTTILTSVVDDGTSCQGYGDAGTLVHGEETDEIMLGKDVEENQPHNGNDRTNVRRGSQSGLTEESKEAISWIHRIPWYYKPALPGFFNLCNSAMRWASLMFIPASVAEMLISGLELVLSVCAARLIRKRMVSKARWQGVGLVAFGIVLVGAVHVLCNRSGSGQDGVVQNNLTAGLLLIVGQCIMSVCQDMAEELFMQEAQFPATLLLGFEGLFGLTFGLIVYVPIAPLFGEDPSETRDKLGEAGMASYACGLTVLVLVTGIFNILATAVTSSMTRNVWKNLRTALVWIFALIIYYCTGNKDLGEAWVIPDSFFVLGGFGVIVAGIYFYYSNK